MAKRKKSSATKKSAAVSKKRATVSKKSTVVSKKRVAASKKPLKARKAPPRKPVVPAKRVSPPVTEPKVEAPQEEKFVIKKILTKSQLQEYKKMLEKVRDRVINEISFLAGDNLNRSSRDSAGDISSYSYHMADQGTDNFDREFALNLVSSEQDVLYEIEDALRRIDMGTYGVCEYCHTPINKARLLALPFTKMCIVCKSESEKGKTRFRPFGPTISQSSSSENGS